MKNFREIAFLVIYEIAKNGLWSKKFREIDLFDFTSFFAWNSFNFLARYESLSVVFQFFLYLKASVVWQTWSIQ